MSKLSFRARTLDSTKRMPVFLADELPDLSEYAAINRSVPQMPSGMEKEEEMEFHLQQAITAQQAFTLGTVKSPDEAKIPIPRVEVDPKYEALYHSNYKPPKQLIRVQAALSLEPEYPEYDLDTEDEQWVFNDGQKLEITPLQFERIMDILEKQSEYKVISVEHAKLLLQEEDDDVVFAVYDYWLKKRVKAQGKRLMPKVRIERREAVALIADPYVGFRRRAEKMQTRKNRKNDEESYEKILKLRNDLQKALTLLEMVKRREKSKRGLIKLELEVAGKRRDMKDFGCEVYIQLKQEVRPSFQFSKEEMLIGRSRRQSNKRRRLKEDRDLVSREWLLENAEQWHKPALFPSTSLTSPLRQIRSPTGFYSSATDLGDANLPGSLLAAEKYLADPSVDGPFAMKRRRGCVYLAPTIDEKFLRFSEVTGLTTCKPNATAAPQPTTSRRCWPCHEMQPPHGFLPSCLSRRATSFALGADDGHPSAPEGLSFVGLVRRRVGRGGRIIFDRLNRSDDSKFEPHIGHGCYETFDKPSTSTEKNGHTYNAVDFRSISSAKMPYYYPSERTLDFVEDWTSVAPSCSNGFGSPASHLLNNSDSAPPPSPRPSPPSSVNEHMESQARRPCAILSGPRGRARLHLAVGVSADVYPSAKRTLNLTPTTATTSSLAPTPTQTLDSRRAFEAAAAAMTVEQMLRLTQRYDRHQSAPTTPLFKPPGDSNRRNGSPLAPFSSARGFNLSHVNLCS